MKSITVVLDDETYSRAELKAGELHTSVSAIAGDYLRRWASSDVDIDQARHRLAALFAEPLPRFSVGTPDDRTLRNARR